MNETFFFDTYAFIELIKENTNYAAYATASVVTSKLNIFELATSFSRLKTDNQMAFLNDQYRAVVDFDLATITLAAKFWATHRKNNVSMTDAIGYILAMRHNILFLTGDSAFEGLPNVRFVK